MTSLVLFAVAQQRCALPIDRVAEIVPVALLSHPPGLPAIVEGFLNLRGQRLPVLRLERLFGQAPSPLCETQHILILKSRSLIFGLWVDYVHEIQHVASEQLANLPSRRVFNECTASELYLNETPIYILDPDQLLLDEERERLKNLQTMETERLRHVEARAA